jgi:hypothetical protein
MKINNGTMSIYQKYTERFTTTEQAEQFIKQQDPGTYCITQDHKTTKLQVDNITNCDQVIIETIKNMGGKIFHNQTKFAGK